MSLYLRGGTWQYDFIINHVRFRGTTGFKENEKTNAVAFMESKKTEAREKNAIDISWEQTKRRKLSGNELKLEFNQIWDEFAKKSMADAGGMRKKIYAQHIRQMCLFFNQQHPQLKNISDVTPEHANEYITYLKNLPGAPATKNDKLSTLKMLFNSLGRSAGIIENPFKDIKKMKHKQSDRDIFSPEELNIIWTETKKLWDSKAKNRWLRSFCIAALCTGQREGDVCSFKRKFFDLENDWIYIPATKKTGAPFDFPLFKEFKEHIIECLQENNNSEYLFPELAEMYKRYPVRIGRELKEFFIKIGITGLSEEVKGYARKVSKKDAHSFRHTTIWMAVEVYNIPFHIVSDAFHDTPAITKRYTKHATRKEKEKHFGQISNLFANKSINNKKKEITNDRIISFLNKCNAANFEQTKQRIIRILEKQKTAPS